MIRVKSIALLAAWLALAVPSTASAQSQAANGNIEGIVRGYRNGLLTGNNYNNLTQCESIDGWYPRLSEPR